MDGEEPERRASISGELVLHDLAAEFTNDLTRRMILVMAELLEIEDVPDQIRLLEDAAVSFTLENERVQHEATAALLPNMIPWIMVSTAGDVGLDESLNVRLAVQVPFDADHPTPLAEELSQIPIEARVTGNAENPQWGSLRTKRSRPEFVNRSPIRNGTTRKNSGCKVFVKQLAN